MSMANSLEAHRIYLDVWQRALDSPKGIRVETNNPIDYRARLYNARAAERRAHLRLYPNDHPMHGRSYYDGLIIRLRDGAVDVVKDEVPAVQEIKEL
jgi:hypothetical protein